MRLTEVFAGFATSAMLLTANPAFSTDVPTPAPQAVVVPALAPPGVQPVAGSLGDARAVMASAEEADAMRKAAELTTLPEVPAGSDLDKLLSGSSPALGGSVASPLAHGRD